MPATRVAVVTGPTSGIGRWIALGLARAGYRLVLIARDPARAGATRDWIKGQVPGAEARIIAADLSLLGQTRSAARETVARYPQIGLLINNAGLITRRRTLTPEGHEMVLAVNYLAPFVLTRDLADALRADGAARVVNIGSDSSDNAELQLDDLEGVRSWRTMRAYGQSKLALLMAGMEWARRFEGSGVSVNTVHPGLVATNIGNLGGLATVSWKMLGFFALRPEQGADAPLHVAVAPELAGVTGRYFRRRKEAAPNQLTHNTVLRARLWDATERLISRE